MKVSIMSVFRRIVDLQNQLDIATDEADRYEISIKLRRIMTTYIHLDRELIDEDTIH